MVHEEIKCHTVILCGQSILIQSAWYLIFWGSKKLEPCPELILSFAFFLTILQVISQAEQEQAELEVKTTKHEIFKVMSDILAS